MIKKISVVLFILMVILTNVNFAADITLEQIVEKFNKSSIVDDYKSVGGSISATNDSDSINITVEADGKTENVEFLFQGNVLSIEIGQEDDESAFAKAYVTSLVIDVIGQLHGYQEGELSQTINSDKANNYTLEKEGYELEKISETKFKIKVDITKKIPLADFSNTYVEVSDLQKWKEYISGEGSVTDSKGNIWFNKSGYDGENTLLVAEKGKLTENTYKSILSILEVMFDNDKVDQYFKNNYPNISTGDKEFKGFSIKVNPKEKTEWEESLIPSDSGYEFIRITINKEQAINQVNKVGETEKETNKEPQKENNQQIANMKELPQTGEGEALVPNVLYIVIAVSCIFLISMIYLLREKK